MEKTKATFTIGQLVDKVKELATKYPQGVYCKSIAGCRYTIGVVKDGPPTCGCIIGQALIELQPTLRPLLESLDKEYGTSVAYLLDTYLDVPKTEDYAEKRRWLMDVQANQDLGETWSKAIEVE